MASTLEDFDRTFRPRVSNILLTPFDKEMRRKGRKGYRLTRYAE